MNMPKRARAAAALLCSVSAAAIHVAAYAQDAGSTSTVKAPGATATQVNSDTSATAGEEIVVTGSRVISDIRNSPTPITQATSEQLLATTPTDLPDALNKLPVFQGSTSQRTGNGGGAGGLNGQGNFLNLRNYGAQRTLVLYDGHRVVPSAQDGTVDVDSLPQMLVSRVDVVTGGASAVYGSDAITGVVNFVLDKKFNGVKYNASIGVAQGGYGTNYQAGMAAGTGFLDDRGHIEASVRYFKSNPVSYLDLPYGKDFWGTTGSTSSPTNPQVMTKDTRTTNWVNTGLIANCGTGCTAAGMQFVSPGILGGFVPGTKTGSSNVYSGGDGGYGIDGIGQAGLKTYETFARVSYDITNSINAYLEGSYVKSVNDGAYYDNLLSTGVDQNIFFKTNAFLPAATQAMLQTGSGNTFTLQKIMNDIDPVSTIGKNQRWSVTAGLTGKLFDRFNWDVYYSNQRNSLNETFVHNVNNARLMAAEDAVTNAAGQIVCYVSTTQYASLYPGCEPINPFGNGQVTRTSQNFWAPNTHFVEVNTLQDAGASIAGDLFRLPAGPVKVALSGEARWQSLSVDSPYGASSTPVNCSQGLRLCPAAAVSGAVPVNTWAFASLTPVPKVSENVWEVAAEGDIPVLADLPLVKALSINVAGRYTHYSSSGGATTWKVGFDYQVNRTIRFRGTTSEDIRAPTLTDLFGPFQSGVTAFADNHTGVGGNVADQVNPSNPNLTPEKARTYTIGVVLTPEFIPNLVLSLDAYRIRMHNAITTITANGTQTLCEASAPSYNSPYCSLIVRPLPFSNTTAANYPTFLLANLVNAASAFTEGMDFEADYHINLENIWSGGKGALDFRELLGYQPKNQTQALPTSPITYVSEPTLRSSTFVSYTVGPWEFAVENRWSNRYKKRTSEPQYFADPDIRSFDSVDLTINRTIGKFTAYVTVNNLTNDPGPLYGGLAGSPGYSYPVPASFPILGRTYLVGMRAKF